MDSLLPILSRDLIIILAVLGAIIATFGSYLVNKRESNPASKKKLSKYILRIGYAITWGSIALFIFAGFTGLISR